jgi:hypothetical protein
VYLLVFHAYYNIYCVHKIHDLKSYAGVELEHHAFIIVAMDKIRLHHVPSVLTQIPAG